MKNNINKSLTYFVHAIENYSPCAPMNTAERYMEKQAGYAKHKSYNEKVWPRLAFMDHYKELQKKTKNIVVPDDQEVIFLWWSELVQSGDVSMFLIVDTFLESAVATGNMMLSIQIFTDSFFMMFYDAMQDIVVHNFYKKLDEPVDVTKVNKENIKFIARKMFKIL